MSKKTLTVALVAVSVFIAALVAVSVFMKSQPSSALRIGDGAYDAQFATKPSTRAQGLSGTSDLGSTDALVFVFPADGKWKIWMKDMNYPLDIVWLDNDKSVIYIVENAPPEGGEDVIFQPPTDARYVIELSSGSVEAKNIVVGDRAEFDSNQGEVN